MNQDTELRDRLAGMESRVPASPPPALAPEHRHHYHLSAASAVALVLVFAATAVAGAVVAGRLAQAGQAPGIQNPGQPLAGYHMECMTPPQAAAFLAEHGYTDVVWQIETGTSKADGTTTIAATPPEHGFVVPGAILTDGKLHMVVDQRVGAQGVGTCHGMPMP
jgi:hypothetical protein